MKKQHLFMFLLAAALYQGAQAMDIDSQEPSSEAKSLKEVIDSVNVQKVDTLLKFWPMIVHEQVNGTSLIEHAYAKQQEVSKTPLSDDQQVKNTQYIYKSIVRAAFCFQSLDAIKESWKNDIISFIKQMISYGIPEEYIVAQFINFCAGRRHSQYCRQIDALITKYEKFENLNLSSYYQDIGLHSDEEQILIELIPSLILNYPIKQGNDLVKWVRWCCVHGASINVTSRGTAPVIFAIMAYSEEDSKEKYFEIVQVLLDHGANPLIECRDNGNRAYTPLLYAHDIGNQKIKDLLQAKVDQQTARQGNTSQQKPGIKTVKPPLKSGSTIGSSQLKGKTSNTQSTSQFVSLPFKTIGIFCLSAAALYFCIDRLYSWWYPEAEEDEEKGAQNTPHTQESHEAQTQMFKIKVM